MAETRTTAPFTQEYLQTILSYDEITGILTWKKISINKSNLLGKRAGSIYQSGHRYVQIDGIDYRTGRLIWFYVYGEWPEDFIDHKNTDKADDKLENLRIATNSQNQANRGLMVTNTSGVKGVRYEWQRSKWRAQIMVNGKSRNLGRYMTQEEAEDAYAKAAQEAWGDFSRTDNPQHAGTTLEDLFGPRK